jgi:hypothetical protein
MCRTLAKKAHPSLFLSSTNNCITGHLLNGELAAIDRSKDGSGNKQYRRGDD